MTPYAVCIIGGTGAQGRGLAVRLASAGHEIIAGSRSQERATDVANRIQTLLPEAARDRVKGAVNPEAAAAADVIVVATPWDEHPESVAWLAPHVSDKVVISCMNPSASTSPGPTPWRCRPAPLPSTSPGSSQRRRWPGPSTTSRPPGWLISPST